MKKIFICGGHVTPALAVMDELAGSSIEQIYIGRQHAIEHTLVTEKGFRFLPIYTGKRTWSTFAKIPIGFLQSLYYCIRERPSLIVSFGGYVALPVAVAGWLCWIPVITHEQTLVLGLANRIITRFAKKVFLTFKETLRQVPSGIVIGLPMRHDIFLPPQDPPFEIETDYPILYITGGSLGAKSLNEILAPAIPELTRSFSVIHQTGLPSAQRARRYIPQPYISAKALSWVLAHAMIVVGRSGANTTIELAAMGKVALLIPLPWAAENEQLAQARWLEKNGGGVVIEQKVLSADSFLKEMKAIRQRYDKLRKRAETLSRTIARDAAKILASQILNLL